MGQFSDNFKKQKALHELSRKNGVVNTMVVHQGNSEMEEIIRKHPEVKKVLDTLTNHFGYFDGEINHTESSLIIHCLFLNGKKLHLVMDFESNKIYILNDQNYKRIKKGN